MKLLYLTNIPAPYRIKRFNDMVGIFRGKEIELEVLFTARTEPNRDWPVHEEEMHFNYKIWPGIHPTISNMYAHFNPSLLWRLTKGDYDVIVIGGMACPTFMLAPFFIRSKVVKILSVESNLKGNTTKTGIRKWLKGKLLDFADAYQITGHLQKEYINYFSAKSEKKTFITLPNLIDGEKFYTNSKLSTIERDSIRRKFGLPVDKTICVIPARMIGIKYPEAFLQSLPKINSLHFALVGKGEMESRIRDLTISLPVTMIPFQQEKDMIQLYGCSDLFCLPSTEDPSPLSTIEACCCSLPIVISKNVGNIGDVLQEGKNGYSLNPYSPEEIVSAFNKFTELSFEERKTMGQHSRERYLQIFENTKCLSNYADQILSLMK